jgi:hypothetical protein
LLKCRAVPQLFHSFFTALPTTTTMAHLNTKQLELMHVAMAAWFEKDARSFTTIDLDKETCGVYSPHTFEVYRGFIIGSSSVHCTFTTLDIGLSDRLGDLDHTGDWYSRALDEHELTVDFELVASLGRNVIDTFYYQHFRAKVYSYWRRRSIEQRIMQPYYRPLSTEEWYTEIEEALAMMVWKGEGQMTERRFFLLARGVLACNELFPPADHDPLYDRFAAEEPEAVEVDV